MQGVASGLGRAHVVAVAVLLVAVIMRSTLVVVQLLLVAVVMTAAIILRIRGGW